MSLSEAGDSPFENAEGYSASNLAGLRLRQKCTYFEVYSRALFQHSVRLAFSISFPGSF